MMELRSAIQVLGISPDRRSWWRLGAEGGQGWNQFTRMFFNITNITNNYNLFRFSALTLLHHNVAWRLATSLFRFSFFAFLKCRLFGIILTVFYFDILYSQVEGVLVTMMTHPEVVELIRGIFLLIKNCQHIEELNKCEVVSCTYAKVLEGSSWQWECSEVTTLCPTLGGLACSPHNFVPIACQI